MQFRQWDVTPPETWKTVDGRVSFAKLTGGWQPVAENPTDRSTINRHQILGPAINGIGLRALVGLVAEATGCSSRVQRSVTGWYRVGDAGIAVRHEPANGQWRMHRYTQPESSDLTRQVLIERRAVEQLEHRTFATRQEALETFAQSVDEGIRRGVTTKARRRMIKRSQQSLPKLPAHIDSCFLYTGAED